MKTKVKVGDSMELLSNKNSQSCFKVGTILKVKQTSNAIGPYNGYVLATDGKNDNYVDLRDVRIERPIKAIAKKSPPISIIIDSPVNKGKSEKFENPQKYIKDSEYEQYLTELINRNKEMTVLQIKAAVKKRFPFTHDMLYTLWYIRACLIVLAIRNVISYNQITSTASTLVKPKVAKAVKTTTNTISKTKAVSLIEASKGKFFTATFVKKDGTERTINCQYLSTTSLGYLKVNELSKLKAGENPTRNLNSQTIKSLKIGGEFYKVK